MTELGNQLETEKEREVFQKAYQLFTKKPIGSRFSERSWG